MLAGVKEWNHGDTINLVLNLTPISLKPIIDIIFVYLAYHNHLFSAKYLNSFKSILLLYIDIT